MRDSFSDHLVAEANEKKKKKMNVTYIFYSSSSASETDVRGFSFLVRDMFPHQPSGDPTLD